MGLGNVIGRSRNNSAPEVGGAGGGDGDSRLKSRESIGGKASQPLDGSGVVKLSKTKLQS